MYLVFDTETTGLPKNFNAPISDSENWPRMVQIAWQLHDDMGNLIENEDYIIQPEGYDIPYNVARIHGITTELAKKEGKLLQDVLVEFQEVIKKAQIGVGQNITFDYNIIGAEFHRKNIENTLQELPKADTMILGTDYCQLPGGKYGKYKSPKLEELYKKLFGEKFDEAHNAAADVNATAQVFFEMLRIGVEGTNNLMKKEVLTEFRNLHPTPIAQFEIVIRRQIENSQISQLKDLQKQNQEVYLGDYFHFHNHSIFSSLQASTHISELIQNALDNDFPAVGMVDFGNLMGAFKFITEVEKTNQTLQKEYEIYLENKKTEVNEGHPFTEKEPRKKPLVPVLGCEFYISDRPEKKQFTKDDPDRRTTMVLLAKNFNGYKNLAKLSSLGFVNGFYFGVPRISKQMILEYKQDLIAISSGISGDIPNAILEYGEQKGEEIFLWWKEHFLEDFYLQIQNHQIPEEDHLNSVLMKWATQYDVKTLAQNETYYTSKEDANIQDILFCIKDGEKQSTPVGKGFGKRKGLPTTEFYLQNREDLKITFSRYPQSFEAYCEFLQKFDPYTLKREVLLPKFDIPKEFLDSEDEKDGGKRGENAFLRYLTYQGAVKRYPEITTEIRERLDFELSVIAKTGYPGYFLIVQDFCNEARKMGVSVGPGRGSAAGSAVAYCIGITNVDPIKYDLLFERFLNPERISMPDIDIDFDDEGRDRVIKWVVEKYGKNNVAQIITYSVLGGKSAIKDAGRVLDLSIPETNKIAKLVPGSPGMNIEKALKKFDKLPPEDKALVEEMKSVLQNQKDSRHAVLSAAQKMEGAIRNTGIHACGVIITPEDISNLVPITIAAKDSDIIVSQFDNSVAEYAGLLKMDFLGLRTLTIIKDAIKLIQENHGIKLNPDEIPLDDEKTYLLFQEGKTIGIFQYESPGMQKYMRELKPTVFADLIAMNALYRPGPIKYIPNFIHRKHGVEEIVYDLPECEEYLAETYGITVYQEQVMLLSQKLANFTKGQADSLRKAMGKKIKKELDNLYPIFIEGGKANQLNEEKLNKIWKDWEAFAEYAFNKSHSTCYALIAYQTAFLKANYPAEYMASVMTHNLNNTKQITLFMEDCKNIGVDVLGPDVNESKYEFAVNENEQIRFGLGAIKGIGEGPSEAIVETRKKGKFLHIFDFFERVPFSQMNKRVAESLVFAGGFDGFKEHHRAQFFDEDSSGKTTIERLIQYGQSFQNSSNQLQQSLFADMQDEVKIETPKIASAPEWPSMFKLNKEKELIGFYLSSHPLDELKHQYQFMQGLLSRKEILEEKKSLELPEENKMNLIEKDDDELLDAEIEGENEILEEEISKNIEPRGYFNFLNLDELDAFREINFGSEQIKLFEEIKDYREKQKYNAQSKEYTVAGLVTEYMVKDGFNAGEKVAFLTLEDYTGSYSFRLGDRDYMKLKDKLDVQRFVIMKIKYSISKDGRVFVNISEIYDLKEAFEKFAKSISVLVNIQDLRKEDVEFFQKILSQNKGENKLSFYIKNPEENSHIELQSMKAMVEINQDLLEVFGQHSKYQLFLN